MEKTVIRDCTLYRGDCLEMLQKHQGTTKKMRAKDRPLANDFLSDEDFEKLLDAWFGNIVRVLEPGRSAYIWGGYANLTNYPAYLKKHGLYFSQCIVWNKMHPVLTRHVSQWERVRGFRNGQRTDIAAGKPRRADCLRLPVVTFFRLLTPATNRCGFGSRDGSLIRDATPSRCRPPRRRGPPEASFSFPFRNVSPSRESLGRGFNRGYHCFIRSCFHLLLRK
ncbi:MAG: hypothetical protein LBQ54_01155 [Planctomycetaceae bacterium]|jgi:hypothetical protein|nr:hypothetical protein [Planctomycetaceae bacterium]